jgi:hypothetical protein
MTESKKCKIGYYYCFTDKKCKKIPMGYHIGSRGYLAKDEEGDDSENKKNGNGESSNGNGGNANGDGGISEEGLRDWFGKSKSKDGKGGWVNVVTGGTCASDKPGEGIPKCVSSSKRASMSKKERVAAKAAKRREDPGQQKKTGASAPTMVKTDRKIRNEEAVSKKQQRFFGMVRATQKGEMENPSSEVAKAASSMKLKDVKDFAKTKHKNLPEKKKESMKEAKDTPGKGSGKKDACYSKVKSRYSVWPSAYASGALVKCRKVGAANWGNSTKEEVEIGEACWKGYEQKGMKTMFGKRYPNCVKKTKKEEVNLGDNLSLHVEGMGNVRYCPQCQKNETREECAYGPKNWDMNSSPAALGSNTFDIASVTPSNEEYVEEKYERIQKTGRTYTIFFTFRGQYKSLQFFFPTSKRPSREDVLIQLRKIYPEAILANFFERDRIENEPLVTVEGVKSFGNFMAEGAAWTKKSGKNKEGGLNEKGRKSYERENPGSDLKAPSKKKGNKRRSSFCARMKGMKAKLTSAKTARDPDSRINKSLRAWNC